MPSAFSDDFHRAVVKVTRPARDREVASLFGGGAAKKYPLHPASENYAESRWFVTIHCDAPPYVAFNNSTNSGSSRVFTPNSRALRNFDPGSAPTTTKSVLRL